MEEKATITFNISGGNNQILPNATQAVQYFYGNEFSENACDKESDKHCSLSSAEVQKLHVYIKDMSVLSDYVSRLGQCKTAKEIGLVVVDMILDEHVSVDQDLAAKAVFIEILKDLSPNLDKGGTTNNIRQRIQDAWSKRPNKKN